MLLGALYEASLFGDAKDKVLQAIAAALSLRPNIDPRRASGWGNPDRSRQ
jgi:hypothetical protein